MKRLKRLSPALVLLGLLVAAGCSDIVSYEPPDVSPSMAKEDGIKFRHAAMLDNARRPSMGKAAGEETIGLVIGLTMEPYKFFDRYKFFSRYKYFSRYEYDNVFFGLAGEIDAAQLDSFLQELQSNPDVTWYEPDIFIKQQETFLSVLQGKAQGIPWGIERIGATESLAKSGDGRGSVDGVDLYFLDSGVYPQDLRVTENVKFGLSANTADEDGHGSHMAGTAAAEDDADGVVGVAPGARVHNLKVLDPGDNTTIADVIAALEHVVARKQANSTSPMVVNLSLGADIGTTEYNALDYAVQAAIGTGITVVAAAGNEGKDVSTISPAHVREAITVGAYDVFNRFASFSNRGAGVDLLAPGVDVLSIVPDPQGGMGLALMSGTSMAAAHVSGAAALVLWQNANATPAQVRNALVLAGRQSVIDAPSGTTNRSVYIGSRIQTPPFFNYAVTSGKDIKLEGGNLKLDLDGGIARNANLYAAGKIEVKSSNNVVKGFGYYAESFSGGSSGQGAFQPSYNPAGLAVVQRQPLLKVPYYNMENFERLATRKYKKDLTLSGSYQLGTKDRPEIWYVDGNVKTSGDVRFSGYGVIFAKGNVEVKHNLYSDNANDENNLGLFMNGKMSIEADGKTVQAQVLTASTFTVEKTATFYGTVTALGSVEFKKPVTMDYRPAANVLTEPFWPTVGSSYSGRDDDDDDDDD